MWRKSCLHAVYEGGKVHVNKVSWAEALSVWCYLSRPKFFLSSFLRQFAGVLSFYCSEPSCVGRQQSNYADFSLGLVRYTFTALFGSINRN